MNAIMSNLGNAIAPSPKMHAGPGKLGAEKAGTVPLPFAALLSDVANQAVSGQQNAPAPVMEATADALPSSDLILVDLPLTEYSETGTGTQTLAAALQGVKNQAAPTAKPSVKRGIEDPSPGKKAIPSDSETDPEADAEFREPEPGIDAVKSEAAHNMHAGEAVAVLTILPAARPMPSVEVQPGPAAKAPSTPAVTGATHGPTMVESTRHEGAKFITLGTDISAPEHFDAIDHNNQIGTEAGKSQPAEGSTSSIMKGQGEAEAMPSPALRQQKATAALLAGLARQKDPPPDIAAGIANMVPGKVGAKPGPVDGTFKVVGTSPLTQSRNGGRATEATPLPAPVLPTHERLRSTDRAAASDVATLPTDVAAQPASNPTPGAIVPAMAGTAPTADLSATLGQQVIDMGSGGQWIDGLAREIAALSQGEGRGSFRLSPENLGPMRVDIRPGEQGANVTLTVETKAAESMLMQDRNLLKADAQLAAVKIDDVTVQRVAHVHEPSRADTATGQGTGGQPQSQTQTSSQGQSGQGSNNAALAQGQNQSGQNGNNPRNHKVSSDAAVSSQAEPRGAGDGRISDDTRRARYA